MSYEEAIKYIRGVLENWLLWKTHHRLLVEALEAIIKHNDDGGNSQ